jgi:WD40 repeat protein
MFGSSDWSSDVCSSDLLTAATFIAHEIGDCMTLFHPGIGALLAVLVTCALGYETVAQDGLPKANASFAYREGKITTLRGDPSAIKSSGILSKDGRYLFGLWSSYDSHERVIIYDLQLMKEVKRIGEPLSIVGDFFAAAVSLDESVVAAAEKPSGTVQVYDVATARSKGKFTINSRGAPSESRVTSLTFSPDADTVYAVTAGGQVTAWSIKAEKFLFQINTREDKDGHSCQVVAASRDGKHLLGVGQSGYLRILDPATGKELKNLDVENVPLHVSSGTSLRSVMIAPNDRDGIVCDTYRGIWHIDLLNQKVRQVAKTGANERIERIALSASGSQIMFNDAGEKYRALNLMPLNGKRKPGDLGLTGAPNIVAVSHAGDRVLLQVGRTMVQWGLPKK